MTSIIEILLSRNNLYHEGDYSLKSGYLWISAINNISVSLSLHSLVLFYMVTEDRLKPFKPFTKFLCIKSIIFFSYWQSCLFNLLQLIGLFNHKDAQRTYNIILSGEIVIAAIAQSFAFSYEPFINITLGKSNILTSINHVLKVNDLLEDAHTSFVKNDSQSGLTLSTPNPYAQMVKPVRDLERVVSLKPQIIRNIKENLDEKNIFA